MMLNGVFHNPTKMIFGSGAAAKVGAETAAWSRRVLLHFGRGSARQSGLYDRVAASLMASGVEFVELGGVQPNPRVDLVREGIRRCREQGLDFVLAVGGGSVIDSAKAIAAGVRNDADIMEVLLGRSPLTSALPVGTLLTVPGAGSESSPGAVITDESRGVKIPFANPLLLPVFSILDPDLTCSLPPRQTSAGIVDAISHVLERYFSNTEFVDCTDRIGEGLIKTLMHYAVVLKDDPACIPARGEVLWACKLAHDETAGFGRRGDWSSHKIAHTIAAHYDTVHGETLAVIFPVWMEVVGRKNPHKILQFGERVLGIPRQGATAGTVAGGYRRFLAGIDMPLRLEAIGVPDDSRFSAIAETCVAGMASGTIGYYDRLSAGDILGILQRAQNGHGD